MATCILPKFEKSAEKFWFKRDLGNERGWRLIAEEDPWETERLLPNQLKTVSIPKKNNRYLRGNKLIRWARDMQPFGQRQAEYLLQRQGEMPVGWRIFHFVFPQTIWQDPSNRQYFVPVIFFDGIWQIEFIQSKKPLSPQAKLLIPRTS